MTNTTAVKRRAQRTARLRRRATVAGVGMLLSAFALVAATTALPPDEIQQASVPASTTVTNEGGGSPQVGTSAAPRRIRTRQS